MKYNDTIDPDKSSPIAEPKASENEEALMPDVKRDAKHQIFGKIAIPMASAALLLASIVSGAVIAKRK